MENLVNPLFQEGSAIIRSSVNVQGGHCLCVRTLNAPHL